MVSAGKVLGTEVRHNEALVMFFPRSRRSLRYGKEPDPRDMDPSHPLYRRVQAQILQEQAEIERREGPVVCAKLKARLENMYQHEVQRRLAKASNRETGQEED